MLTSARSTRPPSPGSPAASRPISLLQAGLALFLVALLVMNLRPERVVGQPVSPTAALPTAETSEVVAQARLAALEGASEEVLSASLAGVGGRAGRSALCSLAPPVGLLVQLEDALPLGGGLPDGVQSLLLWAVAATVLGFLLLTLFYAYQRYKGRQTEARFQKIVDAAPDAMLLLGRRHNILRTNAAAEELLGRPVRELLGKSLEDVVLPVESDALASCFEKLDEGEEMITEEVTRSAGEKGYHGKASLQLRLRLKPVSLDEETAYLGVLRDVTTVNEERALFKYFHRKTLEDLPIEVAVLSPDGKYLYANPIATGEELPLRWLRGRTDFDVCKRLGLHPEVALRRRSHRRRALQTGERVHFEEVLPRRDAPPRHIDRYYTPVLEDDGGGYAIVSYGIDNTKYKQQGAALQRAEEEKQEFAELKAAIMQNMRHEFRTPLTSVIGAAEVLREEALPDQREFVEIIEQNSRRLKQTLDAMLDMADLRGEFESLHPRVIKLADTVENVVEELQDDADKKEIFLRAGPSPANVLVRVDPAGLYRVLRSLLGNAVKFTEEGGVVVEVDAEGQQALVRIIDSGVGIEDEYLPHLFEAFGQESSGTTRSFQGMGVGLTVTRRLIELMDGTIDVDSKKGEGSVFSIALPVAFHQKEIQQGETTRREPQVLAVEQKEQEQKLLHYWLDAHVKLEIIDDLDEALSRARRAAYDAVLVSTDLGSEDGAGSLLDRFREVPSYGSVPIIALDDDALPGAAEQFKTAGYDGYIGRPLKKEKLHNALGDALAEAASDPPSASASSDRDHPAPRQLA